MGICRAHFIPAKRRDIKNPQKESVFNIGDPIDTQAVRQKQKKDKTYRRKISGRRVPTLSLRNNGKYVRHGLPKGEIKDVALDATIRAAAPYQKERKHDSDLAVVIKTHDIQEKIRVGKVSTATMFVVDASGSMGANRRMESAKGAVLSLLLDSYQQREYCREIASYSGGKYYPIADLTSQAVRDIVIQEREQSVLHDYLVRME